MRGDLEERLDDRFVERVLFTRNGGVSPGGDYRSDPVTITTEPEGEPSSCARSR